MNAGIDYGMGLSNIDQSTGIRFGVISINSLPGWILNEEEPDYGEPSCPECGSEDITLDEDDDSQMVCHSCDHSFDEQDQLPEEPRSWKLEADGVTMTRNGDDSDYFIDKSPFYTLCQFCSPCAPGAGYVTNQVEDGVKTYCPPPSWYRDHDEEVPFKTYSVRTGKAVPGKPIRKSFGKKIRKYSRQLPTIHQMKQNFYDFLFEELRALASYHGLEQSVAAGSPQFPNASPALIAEAKVEAFARCYERLFNCISNQYTIHRPLVLAGKRSAKVHKLTRMAMSILKAKISK